MDNNLAALKACKCDLFPASHLMALGSRRPFRRLIRRAILPAGCVGAVGLFCIKDSLRRCQNLRLPLKSAALSRRHLALSTNSIEKISGLAGLPSLEVLSLGRNIIKKLDGVEAVAGTLQQLWISYNVIEKLVRLSRIRE